MRRQSSSRGASSQRSSPPDPTLRAMSRRRSRSARGQTPHSMTTLVPSGRRSTAMSSWHSSMRARTRACHRSTPAAIIQSSGHIRVAGIAEEQHAAAHQHSADAVSTALVGPLWPSSLPGRQRPAEPRSAPSCRPTTGCVDRPSTRRSGWPVLCAPTDVPGPHSVPLVMRPSTYLEGRARLRSWRARSR